jgi:hypothetical protein
MSAPPKKKADWTETILWVALFLLVLVFIYELLKIWNSATATLASLGTAITTAASNTVASIESALSGLLTSPSAVLSNIFGAIPNLLSLATAFFGSLLTSITSGGITGILGGIGGAIGSLFGTALPITSGAGASTTTTLLPSTTGPSTPVNNGTPGSTFSISQGATGS